MASLGEYSQFVKTEFMDESYANGEIEEYPLFVKMEVEDEPSQASIQKRKAKISFEQKKVMIDFLSAHPEMITPSSSLHYVNASRPLWTELAFLLENCSTGARGKTLEEWKRTWQDLKSTTKKRANEVANNKTIAGGPPKPLTDVEIAVLNLMKSSIAVPSPGDNESSLETQSSQNDESVDSATTIKSAVQSSTTLTSMASKKLSLELSQPNPSTVPRPSRTHIQNIQRNHLLRKRRRVTENRLLKKFISVQEERNKLKREELEIKKKMSEAKLEMIQGMIKYFNTGTETMLEAGKAFQKLHN